MSQGLEEWLCDRVAVATLEGQVGLVTNVVGQELEVAFFSADGQRDFSTPEQILVRLLPMRALVLMQSVHQLPRHIAQAFAPSSVLSARARNRIETYRRYLMREYAQSPSTSSSSLTEVPFPMDQEGIESQPIEAQVMEPQLMEPQLIAPPPPIMPRSTLPVRSAAERPCSRRVRFDSPPPVLEEPAIQIVSGTNPPSSRFVLRKIESVGRLSKAGWEFVTPRILCHSTFSKRHFVTLRHSRVPSVVDFSSHEAAVAALRKSFALPTLPLLDIIQKSRSEYPFSILPHVPADFEASSEEYVCARLALGESIVRDEETGQLLVLSRARCIDRLLYHNEREMEMEASLLRDLLNPSTIFFRRSRTGAVDHRGRLFKLKPFRENENSATRKKVPVHPNLPKWLSNAALLEQIDLTKPTLSHNGIQLVQCLETGDIFTKCQIF